MRRDVIVSSSRKVRGRGSALVSGIVRPRLATAGPEKREEGGSTKMATKHTRFTRRDLMKYSGAAGAAAFYGKNAYGQAPLCADTIPIDIGSVAFTTCGVDADLYPPSPFILNPFTDPLPIPQALRPGYRNPDGTLSAGSPQDWTVREKGGVTGSFVSPPSPNPGDQDALGERPMPNDGSTYNFFNPKNGVTTTKTLNF